MDPNVALAELRELAEQETARTGDDLVSTSELLDRFARMAELVAALDAWLGQGGFLPSAWATAR
jgi:hypothetical protein